MRVQRAGEILRWGAIANAIAVVLVLLVSIMAALDVVDDLFSTASNILLAFHEGAGDTAMLAVVLLTLANVSALMVAMVGVLAQEIWSALLTWAIVVVNAVLLVTLGYTPALVAIIPAAMAGIVMFRDFRAFRLNPVMLKEVRERMRGARAFVVITVYLGLMSGFAVLLYLLQRGVVMNNASSVTGELGRIVFAGVVGLELLLIIFIAPAFTAGAVTSERERKTYDLLQITLLPRPSFVMGKLESALSYVFLLLLAAIPLQSIAFLFGGVSETEVLLAFGILAMTAVTLGTVGLFFSTAVDRTLTASVRAYTSAFVVIIGLPLLLGWFVNAFNNVVAGQGFTLFTTSPLVEAIVIYIGALVVSLNPILTALSTQQLLVEQQTVAFFTATLRDGSVIPLASPWISFSIIYLLISTVLVVLAVRRMRRIET